MARGQKAREVMVRGTWLKEQGMVQGTWPTEQGMLGGTRDESRPITANHGQSRPITALEAHEMNHGQVSKGQEIVRGVGPTGTREE